MTTCLCPIGTRPATRPGRPGLLRRALRAGGSTALVTALWLAAGPASAGKAHEHGALRMDLSLEGADLSIALAMPLDSAVGYERAPRTEAERQAAAAALARLRDGAAMFRPDAAAQCSLTSAAVSAPVLERPAPAGQAADGHADLDATYVFRCTQPAKLLQLEVLLFDAFKRVDRIDVQAALPHGQRKATLLKTARVLRLAR